MDETRFYDNLVAAGLSDKTIQAVKDAMAEARGLDSTHPRDGAMYRTRNGGKIVALESAGLVRLYRVSEEVGDGFNRMAAQMRLNEMQCSWQPRSGK